MIRVRSQSRVRRGASRLVGVTIGLAFVAALGIAAYVFDFDPPSETKHDFALSDIVTITKAIESWKLRQKGTPPPDLKALTQPSEERPEPYLASPESIIDPWNQPYQYDPKGTRNLEAGKPDRPDVWTVNPTTGEEIGNWGSGIR